MPDPVLLSPGLKAALAAAGPGDPASRVQEWCASAGIPGLEGRRESAAALPYEAHVPLVADAAEVLGLVAAVPGEGSGLEFIRPLLALAVAGYLRRVPWPVSRGLPPAAALEGICAYARAVPPAEAMRFAVDWAVEAWTDWGAAASDPAATGFAAAALQVAALTVSHVMVRSSGGGRDPETYSAAAQAARELFTGLASTAAPAGVLSVARLIEQVPDRLDAWGYPPEAAARIGTLARICRDFGRSLPRGGRCPGAASLL